MPRPPSSVELGFTTVMLDLARLDRTDLTLPDLHWHVRAVDLSLGRLCDALDDPSATPDPLEAVAHGAYLAVLALGQLLHGADTEDRRARDALDLTRAAIAELLDTLGPLVSHADRAMRAVLLDGEPLDIALDRLLHG
jgi:hypothetical protein